MPASGDDCRPVAVGIDLGGTGTRIVALDSDGVIPRERTTPTATTASSVRAVSDIVETVAGMAADLDLRGVGVGASGPVDSDGIIRNQSTLRAFSNIPLATIIAERLAVPCVIDNDAVTAAIGEHRYGAGRTSDALLVVTLGTGIGVCALSCGRPVRAADGSHPEAGHISVSVPAAPCYCGLAACWEQVASRTALNQLTGGRTEEVAQSARNGNSASTDLFDQYGERVGAGLATLLTLFKPGRVVIGGGAAQYLDLFQAGMRNSLLRSSEYSCAPEVLAAEIGSVAGAAGAAVLSLDTAHGLLYEPVVVHRQEVLQVGDTPLPPGLEVSFVQPAQADAHLGDRDVLPSGERLLSRGRYPALEACPTHGDERNGLAMACDRKAVNHSWRTRRVSS